MFQLTYTIKVTDNCWLRVNLFNTTNGRILSYQSIQLGYIYPINK